MMVSQISRQPASLTSLPPELLACILSYFPACPSPATTQALLALSLACRTLRDFCEPYLYRTIDICTAATTRSTRIINSTTTAKKQKGIELFLLVRTLAQRPHLAGYIRSIYLHRWNFILGPRGLPDCNCHEINCVSAAVDALPLSRVDKEALMVHLRAGHGEALAALLISLARHGQLMDLRITHLLEQDSDRPVTSLPGPRIFWKTMEGWLALVPAGAGEGYFERLERLEYRVQTTTDFPDQTPLRKIYDSQPAPNDFFTPFLTAVFLLPTLRHLSVHGFDDAPSAFTLNPCIQQTHSLWPHQSLHLRSLSITLFHIRTLAYILSVQDTQSPSTRLTMLDVTILRDVGGLQHDWLSHAELACALDPLRDSLVRLCVRVEWYHGIREALDWGDWCQREWAGFTLAPPNPQPKHDSMCPAVTAIGGMSLCGFTRLKALSICPSVLLGWDEADDGHRCLVDRLPPSLEELRVTNDADEFMASQWETREMGQLVRGLVEEKGGGCAIMQALKRVVVVRAGCGWRKGHPWPWMAEEGEEEMVVEVLRKHGVEVIVEIDPEGSFWSTAEMGRRWTCRSEGDSEDVP